MRGSGLLRPDPAWNRLGPPIPLWFRRQLARIDPGLVLQYIPPRTGRWPRGVNRDVYPWGVWDVCKRLPRTGLLHPRAVWSLADEQGWYSPPGPDTIKLIRMAYSLHRRGQMDKLERVFEDSLIAINRAREEKSVARMRDAMLKHCSARFDRQWDNRVYFRRDAKTPKS